LPGEKDPTQAISTCPHCNSCVDQWATQCQNCKEVITPNQGQPHPRKVPQKGERYEEYGPKNRFVNPVVPLASSSKKIIISKKRKNEDHAEHDKDTVKDEYVSDEFRMCSEPKRKTVDNVDIRKEDIMRSCLDLAIDG